MGGAETPSLRGVSGRQVSAKCGQVDTAEEAEAGWAVYARRLRPTVLNWRARFLSDGLKSADTVRSGRGRQTRDHHAPGCWRLATMDRPCVHRVSTGAR